MNNLTALIALALLSFSVAGAYAKTITVASFEPAPFDLSASTNPKLDHNGEPCALIKVPIGNGIDDLTFEGNIIEKINDGSEIQAYITGGTKQIVIKAAGCAPLRIVFAEHGVYRLFPKQVYNLALLAADSPTVPSTSAPAPLSIHELLDNSDGDPIDEMVARANQLYAAGEAAQAIPLLQHAADLGHTEAQLSLGLLYENGVGTKPNPTLKPDPKRAFIYVQKSAQQGYVPAQKVLSRYYLTGVGVDADKERGDFWRMVYDKNTSPASLPEKAVMEERKPEYPGGDSQLFADLNKKMVYPGEAQENGVTGKIIYQFEVGKDGSVSKIKVVRSIKLPPFRDAVKGEDAAQYILERYNYTVGYKAGIKALEKEGIRVISELKKFYPGTQNGTPAKMTYTLPITWSLK